MTSISFDAVARDGTIKIPEKYAKQIDSNVLVVLFPMKGSIDKKSGLIPFFGFDTTNYRFDREEANAR